MSNRIEWIDYAKGIGIILVVFGHVLMGLRTMSISMSSSTYHAIIVTLYGFHMPLFFFLSGLFAENWLKKSTLMEALQSKVQTLILPYLSCYLLYGILGIAFAKYTNSHLTLQDLKYGILFQPYLHFWFLYILFAIFSLYILLRRFFRIGYVALLGIVLYVMTPYLHGWALTRIALFFVYFAAGAWIGYKKCNTAIVELSTWRNVALIAAGFIVINVFSIKSSPNYLFGLLTAVIGSALVYCASYLLSKLKSLSVLRVLGVHSMPIYLLHTLFAAGIRTCLINILDIDIFWVHLIIGTAAGIYLPLIAYNLIKKAHANTVFFGM